MEPVSSLLATTESCLPPIWIKRGAMNCLRPGGIPPQRNVGAAEVSGRRSQIHGSRHPASNPQLAHPADDPDTTTQAVTAGLHPDSLVHAQTPLLADLPSPNHSDETAFHIERLLRLQHVIACPRQLVRQRLGCHHPVRSGFLPVEESPCFLNALGEAGKNADWLTPHAEYERLGRDAAERQGAYRQLFRAAVSQDDLKAIRECKHKGWALGSERFQEEIERLTQRRASSKGVGRPRKERGA